MSLFILLTCLAKVTSTFSEGLRLLLKDVVNYCKTLDHYQFKKRLWQDTCDQAIKNNLKILQSLYDKYTNPVKVLKGVRYLTLTGFQNFVDDTGLIDKCITERDPAILFSLSMMTQVNELDSDRHLQMSFVEFIEAFARLADKLELENQSDKLHLKILELIKISATHCLDITYEVKAPVEE
jgi:hypothetical protein